MAARKRATDAQTIRAGLLLPERPGLRRVALRVGQVAVQRGPLEPRLDLDLALHAIEFDHARQRIHVQQQAVGHKLLAAHRVPPTGNRERLTLGARRPDGGLQLIHRRWSPDRPHARGVEL
jgi:hypothetical protein